MKQIPSTRGRCKYCGKSYGFTSMQKHLASCEARGWESTLEKKEISYFTVAITSVETPLYWLLVELPETAELAELDAFLRDIWCDCCGHRSAFTIRGETYEQEPEVSLMMGVESKSSFLPIKRLFYEDLTFSFTYDFGDSTQLELRVLPVRQGEKPKKNAPMVTILSRNDPPRLTCGVCGKPAVWVDTDLRYSWDWDDPEESENPFFCADCMKKYAGPDQVLPVCNSPRMGVCAYEGSSFYPDQFEPDPD